MALFASVLRRSMLFCFITSVAHLLISCQTAMLLSICGTNAICLNHLHTNTEENARKLTAFIDGMIQGKTVGHAARMSPLSPAADPGLLLFVCGFVFSCYVVLFIVRRHFCFPRCEMSFLL